MVSEKNFFATALGVGTIYFFAYGVDAQSLSMQGSSLSLPTPRDCSEVNIQYAEDNKLTKEEKIALMDEALLRSLSKFDDCKISQMTSSNGGGNSGSDGLEGNNGGGSVASSDMSGSDISKIKDYAGKGDGVSANIESQVVANKDEIDNGSSSRTERSLDNGKIPEDLLYADSDSVLQAQIRKAAMNEKDPKVRAKLWNEYRKYKGKSKVE